MKEKIGIKALKDVKVLYKGDVYDLACLLLKISDAKGKKMSAGKKISARPRYTVHGLATTYSLITHLHREEIIAILESHGLPLGAVVGYDEDV